MAWVSGRAAASLAASARSSPALTPTPTPTPTPAPSPTPTPTAGTGTDFASRAAALYTSPPSIANCQAGQLTSAATAAALQSLNTIRALHKLPAVTYSIADEAGAQQSALMQAANDTLSHTPPTTWKCYTTLGATVSGQSNLYAGFGNGLTFMSDDAIMAGWLTELNNIVADSVGHRRWLLYPFLGAVSYGRVVGASPTQTRGDAAALKVFGVAGSGVANGTLPAYVAYPYQDYPAKYFDTAALLSFEVIASSNPNSAANSSVNFTSARVTVTQRGGSAMTVSKVTYDNVGYGLPNNLQWAVAGLQANTYYDVSITGVLVNGQTQSYSYYFRVVP
ncbi:CAP domain-containing protein [uncultured Sphingomonas sp.]|uniref:CAP domain-containing protein n=1 Tax=uncultured Sphingomonas sp. TaxID=158754 RepID=UPI0035CCA003